MSVEIVVFFFLLMILWRVVIFTSVKEGETAAVGLNLSFVGFSRQTGKGVLGFRFLWGFRWSVESLLGRLGGNYRATDQHQEWV